MNDQTGRQVSHTAICRPNASPRPRKLEGGLGARRGLRVAGLFAGIGGFEQGLHLAGHETVLLCERMDTAREVLRSWFPGVRCIADVADLAGADLAGVDLVAAGFPCQDLSQAGRTRGIHGSNSGLVARVFALIGRLASPPTWLLLENVPFMLHLNGGEGIRYLTASVEKLGYRWAYRTVDARAFGLPQRRRRVILLAGQPEAPEPRDVLLADEMRPPTDASFGREAFGFYWTEGLRGLGWTPSGVPPLKGGSGLGIPSPPAVWLPGRKEARLVTPCLTDAERLQGFAPGWTAPADQVPQGGRGARWKLVGNAVPIPLSHWVGRRLAVPGRYDPGRTGPRLEGTHKWPRAAWGDQAGLFPVTISEWPERHPYTPLHQFLDPGGLKPLSARATAGFQSRALRGTLNFDRRPGFLEAVGEHLRQMNRAA